MPEGTAHKGSGSRGQAVVPRLPQCPLNMEDQVEDRGRVRE